MEDTIMNDRHFSNFNIAGFTYYDGIEVFSELKIGTLLTMVAEPNNKYDPSAVAIYYNDKKLGFVPRENNELLFKFMELGHKELFEIRVNRISPESHPEKQIGVIVRINEKNKNENPSS
ncbi:MAG TPA: HIRAN domain-containing protein [Prolixibacteraceae bacterium]|nr:restriction endonuclease [Bacteroidales bacterium]HPB05925.1 HIRAN domain-containing protein [Prolixibacteraceae bacterium]HUM89306.1 HIRAN domain-containing protein [Prolixibacteraceae bacterium]